MKTKINADPDAAAIKSAEKDIADILESLEHETKRTIAFVQVDSGNLGVEITLLDPIGS